MERPREASTASPSRLRLPSRRRRLAILVGTSAILLLIAAAVSERKQRRKALILEADLIVLNHDLVSLAPGKGSPLEHAWDLREQADDGDSLARAKHLLLLARQSDDGSGSRFWSDVGRAIERLDVSDPLRTPTDKYGMRVGLPSDRWDTAWWIGSELCELRLDWARSRKDAAEVHRLWSKRLECVLAPGTSLSALGAHAQFQALVGFCRHCLDTRHAALVPPRAPKLMEVARAAGMTP